MPIQTFDDKQYKIALLNDELIAEGLDQTTFRVIQFPGSSDAVVVYDNELDLPVIQSTASNHDSSGLQEGELERHLENYTKSQVVTYIRSALSNADGDPQAISAIYNNVKSQVQSRQKLDQTMETFKTLHNVANPLDTLDLLTNKGKAQYVLYFLQAVAIWS